MTAPSIFDEKSSLDQRAQQVDGVAWAAFFIWLGVGMLAAVPWGWFLVGAAALIGIAQLARWQLALKVDGFWVACGAVIFAAGVWEILSLPWALAPILLIALGVFLLVKTIVGASPNV